MDEKEQKIAEEVKFLESIRCSISFLFEMELWENHDKAETLYKKFQSLLEMKPNKKGMWALDSFRYIDPVYIQNYVLGEIYANKIVNSLKNRYDDDYNRWGQKIFQYFLKEGMQRSFNEKYRSFNYQLNKYF